MKRNETKIYIVCGVIDGMMGVYVDVMPLLMWSDRCVVWTPARLPLDNPNASLPRICSRLACNYCVRTYVVGNYDHPCCFIRHAIDLPYLRHHTLNHQLFSSSLSYICLSALLGANNASWYTRKYLPTIIRIYLVLGWFYMLLPVIPNVWWMIERFNYFW